MAKEKTRKIKMTVETKEQIIKILTGYPKNEKVSWAKINKDLESIRPLKIRAVLQAMININLYIRTANLHEEKYIRIADFG